MIPYRSNARVRVREAPRNLSKLRDRIEQLIGKLKRLGAWPCAARNSDELRLNGSLAVCDHLDQIRPHTQAHREEMKSRREQISGIPSSERISFLTLSASRRNDRELTI
jgi:hypothetical protein